MLKIKNLLFIADTKRIILDRGGHFTIKLIIEIIDCISFFHRNLPFF